MRQSLKARKFQMVLNHSRRKRFHRASASDRHCWQKKQQLPAGRPSVRPSIRPRPRSCRHLPPRHRTASVSAASASPRKKKEIKKLRGSSSRPQTAGPGSPRPGGDRFASVTLSHSPNALFPSLKHPFVATNGNPSFQTSSNHSP